MRDGDKEITLTATLSKAVPVVRWYCGTKEIRPDGSKYLTSVDGAKITLTIRNPAASDIGRYRVEVSAAFQYDCKEKHFRSQALASRLTAKSTCSRRLQL